MDKEYIMIELGDTCNSAVLEIRTDIYKYSSTCTELSAVHHTLQLLIQYSGSVDSEPVMTHN